MHSGEFQYRTFPERGESLTSWLVRISHRFALRPYSFGLIMWRGVAIWNRDIDGLSNPIIWQRLAEANRVSSAAAHGTTISSLAGRVFDQHVPNGKTKHLLRLGVFHRSRRRYGQQFCPHCLASDPDPYYRLKWRLAFTVACTTHRRAMLDRCQSCGHPVEFHRGDPLKTSIVQCHACKGRLDRQRSPAVSPVVLDLQAHLESAISKGHTQFSNISRFRSVDLLSVYSQILRVVSTGPRSQSLRDVLSLLYGTDPSPLKFQTRAREFEVLDIENRMRLVEMCAPLLLDWPDRFVQACRKASFWTSWALRDGKDLPAAYEHVARVYLNGSAFLSSRTRNMVSTQIVSVGAPTVGSRLFRRSDRSGGAAATAKSSGPNQMPIEPNQWADADRKPMKA
jgi:hypothetical protein